MMPLSVSAETILNVDINDTSLKDGVTYAKNASGDVKELPEITNDGTVKCVYNYEDDSATLYLNNVTIENKNGDKLTLIDSNRSVSKLNIVLVGENKIIQNEEEYASGIVGQNITISGAGSLCVKVENGFAIHSFRNMTIDGVKLTTESNKTGLLAGEEGIAANIDFNGAAVVEVISDYDVAIGAATDINFNLTSGGVVKAKLNSNEGGVAVCTYSPRTITLGTNNVITVPSKGVVVAKESYAYIAASADADPALEVEVKYVAPVGADTGDSNNIALFAIMGVLALAGAGIAMKKREN